MPQQTNVLHDNLKSIVCAVDKTKRTDAAGERQGRKRLQLIKGCKFFVYVAWLKELLLLIFKNRQ